MRPGDQNLYSVIVGTGQVTKIITLPAHASISTLNSDETVAAGTFVEGDGLEKLEHKSDPNLRPTAVRATAMDERLAAHVPMVLFTLNLQSGTVTPILHSTDWISHVEFSPTDPTLLMYCHEGLWFRVDRIWTIRSDGTHNELLHKRTMNSEIAGHEFWDADGKTIWYDLQIPRGQNFYLASYTTETKERRWYSVERDAWSIHYNAASDDSIFCGDGGDYSQVAKSKNGQWIELLSPRRNPPQPEVDQTGLIQSGFFVSEHLVNMSKNKYTLEPNVRFSPDHKMVIFTSNMFGPSYVFAVDVARANKRAATQQ
jgi:oligogalacturonide lyase